MSHSVPTKHICGLLLLALISSASCQQQQLQLNPSPAIPLTDSATKTAIVPNSPADSSSGNQTLTPAGASNWPWVNVDNASNKSVVDVKVPIVFNMLNQVDKNTGDHKLDLSVLQGLVTVNKDKARNEKGEVTGPLKVTVFGIPVYNGRNYLGSGTRASGEPAATSVRSNSDNSIQASSSGTVASAEESLSGQVRAFNEKVTRSLSDLLARLSTNVRRASQQINGADQASAPGQTAAKDAPFKQ